MSSEEHYLSIEQLKNIMGDYAFQYIICGECAVDLFLKEYMHTKEIMSLTISREEMEWFNTYLHRKNYTFQFKNALNELEDIHYQKLIQYNKYYVYDQTKNINILKIYIYDTKDDKWQFSHDKNIEIEDYKIYFHSLEYDVKYLRPEIQMMYKLYHELRQDDIYRYQKLIQHLSYYQFFMLRKVIGADKLNKIILADC